MAAIIAKDLRLELEEMMQVKMQDMLMELEARLAKAVTNGEVLNNQPAQIPSQAKQQVFSQEDLSGPNASREALLNEDLTHVADQELGEVLSAGALSSSRDVRYKELSSMSPGDEPDEASHTHLNRMNVITLVMLLLNAVGDIFEVDCQARQSTDNFPSWYKAVQLALCTGFVLELIGRVRVKGWTFFYVDASTRERLGKSAAVTDLRWNYFQVTLVVAQVGEVTMIVGEWWFGLPPLSMQLRNWFRMLSVTRIFRAFSILDKLDCTTELHLLLASMHGSLSSLSWSVLFIVIPMFVFGVAITQLVSEFRISSEIDESKLGDMMHFFGTLDRSMLTLFWAISGGLSWSEATAPLSEYNFVGTSVAFVLYVAAMSFATLNVLTGVFVNSAQTAATSEKDKRILLSLQKIFLEVDFDGSGNLTQSEFKALLKHKDIERCLQTLDIRPNQANHLFHLIDGNQSGVIEIDEFLKGCDRLQGNLKAIDFATFLLEFEGFRAEMQAMIKQFRGDGGQSGPVISEDKDMRISRLPSFKRDFSTSRATSSA